MRVCVLKGGEPCGRLPKGHLAELEFQDSRLLSQAALFTLISRFLIARCESFLNAWHVDAFMAIYVITGTFLI